LAWYTFGHKPWSHHAPEHQALFNFDPLATDEEIRAASLQFVRKLSGFNRPSKANEAAFARAVDESPPSRGCSSTRS